MSTQHQAVAVTAIEQPSRDPQNFTRGDVIAWKVVAYAAAGVTVFGSAAAILAVVVLAG